MSKVSMSRLRSSVPDSQIPSPPHKRRRRHDSLQLGCIEDGAGSSGAAQSRPRQEEVWSLQLVDDAASIAEAAIREAGDKFELYGAGSLLALHLRDFQVCVDVSYHFSPAFNMIVGPNGSGKSTVISALLLMFGASSTTRGQKALADYIRVGKDEAEVTVVIRAPPESRQRVIVLNSVLVKKDNHVSQNVKINGHRSDVNHLKKLSKIVKIHPDNLTQFLPQERVGAFSAATPAERLLATEEAVGGPELVEIHTKLSEDGPSLAKVATQLASHREKLDSVNAEITQVETNLAALQSRREDMARLKKLKASEPLIRLAKMEVAKEPAEAEYRAAKAKYKEVVEGTRPQLEDAEKLEELGSQFEAALQESEQKLNTENDRFNLALTSTTDLLSEMKSARFKLVSLKEKKSELLREAIEAQTAVRKQIRILKSADPPPSSDMVQKALEKRDLAVQHNANASERRAAAENSLLAARRHYSQLRMKADSLQRLVNLSKTKEVAIRERLEKIYPDPRARKMMVDALRIVSSESWNSQIFPPLIVSGELALEGASPYLPNIVSELVPLFHVTKFVCTDNADYTKLGRLFGENRISLSVADYSGRAVKTREQIERENPFGGRQQMQDAGFDGLVIDLIKGPPALISMLCESGGFHRIPYSLTQDEARLRVPDNVRTYATLSAVFTTQRSRYGRQLQFTNVRSIPQGHPNPWVRALRSPLVESQSQARKDELERLGNELEQAQERIELETETQSAAIENQKMVRNQGEQDMAHYKRLLEQIQLHKSREERVSSSVSAAQSAYQSYLDAVAQINQTRNQLVTLAQKVPAVTGRISALLQPYTLATEETTKIMYTPEYISRIVDEIQKRVESQRETAHGELEAAKEVRDRLTLEYREYHDTVMPQIRQVLSPTEIEEARKEAAEPNAQDDLQRKIRLLDSQLVLTETGFSLADLERQLETHQNAKSELETKIAEETERAENLSSTLSSTRETWFNSVKSMVHTVSLEFTQMFEALGYHGRVQLETGGGEPLDENASVDQLNQRFSEWGISILVSFRAGEPLKPLSRMRQSGGEKATTTAVYLLALQKLAKAPFTVLDEINQGMDSHNELAIHKQIVERACQSVPSQCLLVTPKLLPGLTYDAGVKVHVIIGGIHVVKSRMVPCKMNDI